MEPARIRDVALALLSFVLGLLAARQVAGDDFADLYKRVSPSVVTIHTLELVGDENGVRPQSALGSGVLVDSKGLIMSAAHVVHSADRIVVEFGVGQQIAAHVISSSVSSDLALIQLERPPHQPVVARLGDSDAVQIGERALVIGAPFGIQRSLSVGYISGRQTGLLPLSADCNSPVTTTVDWSHQNWSEIVASAWGTTVRMAMWDGDPVINAYMRNLVRQRMRSEYAVDVQFIGRQGNNLAVNAGFVKELVVLLLPDFHAGLPARPNW